MKLLYEQVLYNNKVFFQMIIIIIIIMTVMLSVIIIGVNIYDKLNADSNFTWKTKIMENDTKNN